ncbi:MAG TPA: DUF4198 domain-containing protein, partial [Thermoanaerobaculia bacterium]|nr:DUF4198 domain-containing protein [Thermoanaerobaculia bacterium]
MKPLRWIALAAVLVTAASVRAHDFWIEPSTFHPAAGETVAVGLRVGENFIGDPVPRALDFERFVLLHDDSEDAISGATGSDPAGFLQAPHGASSMIVFRGSPAYVELPPPRFEIYLRRYGLDAILAERKRRGEEREPGREYFSRCAKAILTGNASSPLLTQPAGMRYEIVPDVDPTRGTAPFRGHVLFEGKPLAGALVVAAFRDTPVHLTMHTNAQGEFAFTSARKGVWLITSVRMVRAPFWSKADWESLWASLT